MFIVSNSHVYQSQSCLQTFRIIQFPKFLDDCFRSLGFTGRTPYVQKMRSLRSRFPDERPLPGHRLRNEHGRVSHYSQRHRLMTDD